MNAIRTTLILALGAIAQAPVHADWVPVLLEPFGAAESKCYDAFNGIQCGYSNMTGQGTAMLWYGSRKNYADIGQSGWLSSAANSISGDSVVISALTTMMGHGQLYSIADQTYVQLTPPGYQSSAMEACYGGNNTQVGGGAQMMGSMLLWSGTADSAINLTPPGWVSSAAAGCAGEWQVGNGFQGFMGFGRPFLTHGTAASYVDLTPPGSTSAGVADCDLNSQVGSVLWPSVMMGHACIWHGTAESCVDIHPFGGASSAVTACWGDTQVGSYVASTGGGGRAVAWHGSAESAIDLHQMIVDQLGPQYVQTEATSIDPVTGDIVGNAYTFNGMFMVAHAVMWQRVIVPGDLNADGVVNAEDLAALLSAWGPTGGPADIDGDGTVSGADLALLLGNWTI